MSFNHLYIYTAMCWLPDGGEDPAPHFMRSFTSEEAALEYVMETFYVLEIHEAYGGLRYRQLKEYLERKGLGTFTIVSGFVYDLNGMPIPDARR